MRELVDGRAVRAPRRGSARQHRVGVGRGARRGDRRSRRAAHASARAGAARARYAALAVCSRSSAIRGHARGWPGRFCACWGGRARARDHRARRCAPLQRAARGSRRAGAARRGRARSALAARIDPLSRRDAAQRAERRSERGAGAAARPHLQRCVRAEHRRERRHRLRARRRPPHRSPAGGLLGARDPPRGARHCAAAGGGEGAGGEADAAGRGLSRGASRRAESRAAQPHDECAQVHVERVRRDLGEVRHRARGWSSRCATRGAEFPRR